MFNASGSKKDAETVVRRLEERADTQERGLTLLRDELDSRINMLQSEWRQYQTEIMDLLDKIDHIAKRHRKRRARETVVEGDPGVDAEQAPEAATDPITLKVQARRNRALRTENVPG